MAKITLTRTQYNYEIAWPVLSAFCSYTRHRPTGPKGPLLPNLRVLYCDFYSPWSIPECFLLVAGHALKELHLTRQRHNGLNTADCADLTKVVHMLAVTSPNLQYVGVWHTGPATDQRFIAPNLVFSRLFLGLHRLQNFACTLPVQYADIAVLAAKTQLSSLSINFQPSMDKLPPLPVSDPFQRLETLVLRVEAIEHATAFLRLLRASSLKKLTVVCPTWHNEDVIQAYFKAVSAHVSLRDLTVEVSGLSPRLNVFDGSQQCNVNFSSLCVLLVLGNLESLSLKTSKGGFYETDLDDAGVDAMAKAWPNLRHLTIVQAMNWTTPLLGIIYSRITMKGILSLRNHCAQLAGISLSINALSLNADLMVLQAACTGVLNRGQALGKFSVGPRSTRASDYAAMAQLIRMYFPNLSGIHDGSVNERSEVSADWREVENVLRKMITRDR